ncbi:chymotrypsin BII-like [Penaeus vannamei]|uniref:chymotrypsin BII-like n=1 Tax=Penaeus vannamei TaxID=6689 RepID=UPI00387F980D
MCAIIVFVFTAICYPAVAGVPIRQLTPVPPIEVPAKGPPLPESTGGPPPGQRIVGGREALPHEHGYQACLLKKTRYLCGGAILSDMFILTSANCVSDSAQLYVLVGRYNLLEAESSSQRIPVGKVFIHPDFHASLSHLKADIALVKLKKKIDMNDKVFPIKLPTSDAYNGMPLVVTGWGKTLHAHGPGFIPLQVMETRAMSRMECMDAYGNVDIICTTSEFQTAAPCDGDFGSPAVFNDTLYGISSFISGCKTQSPQGFINVFFYRKFIDKVMNPNAAPNGCGILDLSLVHIVLVQLFCIVYGSFFVYFVH